MQRDEIFLRVRAAMVRVFQLRNGDTITMTTAAAEIDGWDSLSHAMLIMALENDLHVDLPLDRASLAQNVGDLVDLVDEALR